MSSEEPSIIVATRPQLFHLLAEAAEIEHTLMCTYLYAAFSLKDGEDEGLTPEELAAIGRWRRSIVAVALDEMVHLLLVSNLSIAIGARPHFSRPNFPVAPGYFPAEVVVRLTRFDEATLDHFVYLERPRGFDLPDGEGFEPPREYVREEAYEGLMPSMQDYATIGHLYDALRANLVSVARRVGESMLFLGSPRSQVDRDAVDLEGVGVITDLASALRALDVIIEQGEGSPADREDSHYQRFTAIRHEYRELKRRNPSFEPGRPAATSPVMRRPPEPEGKVFVDAPLASRVLDLGNAVYATLLQLIVQAFHRAGPQASADQQALLGSAIELMHVLARIGRALTRLPASDSAPGINAGLSFTMLRGVEPHTPEAERRLLAERLQELADGARRLGALPGAAEIGAALQRQADTFR
jgi:hypothetical protein